MADNRTLASASFAPRQRMLPPSAQQPSQQQPVDVRDIRDVRRSIAGPPQTRPPSFEDRFRAGPASTGYASSMMQRNSAATYSDSAGFHRGGASLRDRDAPPAPGGSGAVMRWPAGYEDARRGPGGEPARFVPMQPRMGMSVHRMPPSARGDAAGGRADGAESSSSSDEEEEIPAARARRGMTLAAALEVAEEEREVEGDDDVSDDDDSMATDDDAGLPLGRAMQRRGRKRTRAPSVATAATRDKVLEAKRARPPVTATVGEGITVPLRWKDQFEALLANAARATLDNHDIMHALRSATVDTTPASSGAATPTAAAAYKFPTPLPVGASKDKIAEAMEVMDARIKALSAAMSALEVGAGEMRARASTQRSTYAQQQVRKAAQDEAAAAAKRAAEEARETAAREAAAAPPPLESSASPSRVAALVAAWAGECPHSLPILSCADVSASGIAALLVGTDVAPSLARAAAHAVAVLNTWSPHALAVNDIFRAARDARTITAVPALQPPSRPTAVDAIVAKYAQHAVRLRPWRCMYDFMCAAQSHFDEHDLLLVLTAPTANATNDACVYVVLTTSLSPLLTSADGACVRLPSDVLPHRLRVCCRTLPTGQPVFAIVSADVAVLDAVLTLNRGRCPAPAQARSKAVVAATIARAPLEELLQPSAAHDVRLLPALLRVVHCSAEDVAAHADALVTSCSAHDAMHASNRAAADAAQRDMWAPTGGAPAGARRQEPGAADEQLPLRARIKPNLRSVRVAVLAHMRASAAVPAAPPHPDAPFEVTVAPVQHGGADVSVWLTLARDATLHRHMRMYMARGIAQQRAPIIARCRALAAAFVLAYPEWRSQAAAASHYRRQRITHVRNQLGIATAPAAHAAAASPAIADTISRSVLGGGRRAAAVAAAAAITASSISAVGTPGTLPFPPSSSGGVRFRAQAYDADIDPDAELPSDDEASSARGGSDMVRSEWELQQRLAEMEAKERRLAARMHSVVPVPDRIPTQRMRMWNSLTSNHNARLSTDGAAARCADVPLFLPCAFVPSSRTSSTPTWFGGCNCPVAVEVQTKATNPWSDAEKLIFMEKFMHYPKDFARIASFLPHKNAQDCVAFYYDTKHVAGYKHRLKAAANAHKRRIHRGAWMQACGAARDVGVPLHADIVRSMSSAKRIIPAAKCVSDVAYSRLFRHPGPYARVHALHRFVTCPLPLTRVTSSGDAAAVGGLASPGGAARGRKADAAAGEASSIYTNEFIYAYGPGHVSVPPSGWLTDGGGGGDPCSLLPPATALAAGAGAGVAASLVRVYMGADALTRADARGYTKLSLVEAALRMAEDGLCTLDDAAQLVPPTTTPITSSAMSMSMVGAGVAGVWPVAMYPLPPAVLLALLKQACTTRAARTILHALLEEDGTLVDSEPIRRFICRALASAVAATATRAGALTAADNDDVPFITSAAHHPSLSALSAVIGHAVTAAAGTKASKTEASAASAASVSASSLTTAFSQLSAKDGSSTASSPKVSSAARPAALRVRDASRDDTFGSAAVGNDVPFVTLRYFEPLGAPWPYSGSGDITGMFDAKSLFNPHKYGSTRALQPLYVASHARWLYNTDEDAAGVVRHVMAEDGDDDVFGTASLFEAAAPAAAVAEEGEPWLLDVPTPAAAVPVGVYTHDDVGMESDARQTQDVEDAQGGLAAASATLQRWNKEEKAAFLRGFRAVGRDWRRIHDEYVPGRTPVQIRNFFQNNKGRLQRLEVTVLGEPSGESVAGTASGGEDMDTTTESHPPAVAGQKRPRENDVEDPEAAVSVDESDVHATAPSSFLAPSGEGLRAPDDAAVVWPQDDAGHPARAGEKRDRYDAGLPDEYDDDEPDALDDTGVGGDDGGGMSTDDAGEWHHSGEVEHQDEEGRAYAYDAGGGYGGYAGDGGAQAPLEPNDGDEQLAEAGQQQEYVAYSDEGVYDGEDAGGGYYDVGDATRVDSDTQGAIDGEPGVAASSAAYDDEMQEDGHETPSESLPASLAAIAVAQARSSGPGFAVLLAPYVPAAPSNVNPAILEPQPPPQRDDAPSMHVYDGGAI